MQSIEIANKKITYEHNISLTYMIKITKTRYINKQTGKLYERYKIRIPSELHSFLKNKNNLYFSKTDVDIHITFERRIIFLLNMEVAPCYKVSPRGVYYY